MARQMSNRGKSVYTRVRNLLSKKFSDMPFTSADVKDELRGVRRVEVNNMLNKLETEGMVRRIGLMKTYNGVGRQSVVWALVEDVAGWERQKAENEASRARAA